MTNLQTKVQFGNIGKETKPFGYQTKKRTHLHVWDPQIRDSISPLSTWTETVRHKISPLLYSTLYIESIKHENDIWKNGKHEQRCNAIKFWLNGKIKRVLCKYEYILIFLKNVIINVCKMYVCVVCVCV